MLGSCLRLLLPLLLNRSSEDPLLLNGTKKTVGVHPLTVFGPREVKEAP